MDQHPIPRQITSFEFKLIGFMTLKQFLYMAVSVPLGFIVFRALPIPIVNVVLGVIVGAIGAVFAFIPFQDRPIEEWIRNFIRRLNSPTQFFYKKEEQGLYFLQNLYYVSDPHVALAHVESREKLAAYMQSKQVATTPVNQKKSRIDTLLRQSAMSGSAQTTTTSATKANPTIDTTPLPGVIKQPFMSGTVKNKKQLPLPGILVTIKDAKGAKLRLLKSNPHGVFATYSPLPTGDYQVELNDPNGIYFFDTMNIQIQADHRPTLAFFSKEVS